MKKYTVTMKPDDTGHRATIQTTASSPEQAGKQVANYLSAPPSAIDKVEEDTPEGLILRTVIDIAFADLVTSYRDRQKAIDTIFARIESLKLGDWITEDTGRKFELTYTPKARR